MNFFNGFFQNFANVHGSGMTQISVNGKVVYSSIGVATTQPPKKKLKTFTVQITGTDEDGKKIDLVESYNASSNLEIRLTSDSVSEVKVSSGKILVNGNSGSISTGSGEVLVQKDSGTINTASGIVNVNGNVNGNVQTMSGSVKANSVSGSISTMSGSVFKSEKSSGSRYKRSPSSSVTVEEVFDTEPSPQTSKKKLAIESKK
jgi:hypothetical protein